VVPLTSDASFADTLPTHVYIARGKDGACLYVGMTGNLRRRIRTHISTSSWWAGVAELTVETHDSRKHASEREGHLIDVLDPPHNRTDESWRHRDEVVWTLLSLGLPQSEIAWELDIAEAAVGRSTRRLRRDGRLDHLKERINGKSVRQQRNARRARRSGGGQS